MKITKKQELELTLIDFKSLVEQAWNKEVERDINSFGADHYTLWLGRYNVGGISVSCIAGEPTRYWFDKRISPVELRGIMRQHHDTQYFILRFGSKRPRWVILDATKFAA
jgi:hypothetical protein